MCKYVGIRDIIIEYRKLNAVNDNIKQVTHTGERIECGLTKWLNDNSKTKSNKHD